MKRALASLVASAMLLFALAGCSNGNNPAENPAASPMLCRTDSELKRWRLGF